MGKRGPKPKYKTDDERREAERLYQAEWRRKNPEKAKATERRYREKNPDKCVAATRKWREKNREHCKEYSRRRNKERYPVEGEAQRAKQKAQRDENKNRAVAYLGGSCRICGFSKSNYALDFHHIDPNEKELLLANALKTFKDFNEFLKPELDKCALLCRNCHAMLHAGELELPETKPVRTAGAIAAEDTNKEKTHGIEASRREEDECGPGGCCEAA